ncbi:MAG: HEPN domain-containing protein [Thermodesulfovibrionales bacterium]|nr:HEPN domain-containing protein [Thermodesulfovibrionales bacterium]
MTLESKDKKSLSNIRMARAYEFLKDAKANFKETRYKTAINRSYYAALSAVRAILILAGANPETHEGIVTMLSLRFIKPGILPVDIVKKFKVLLSRRTDVDYGDFETVNKADAKDSIVITEKIIRAMDKARKKILT